MNQNQIIAAVRTQEEFETALSSGVSTVFWLTPNLLTIGEYVKRTHAEGKKLFVHMDLAEGLGKDKAGIHFLKRMAVDGIISTRNNIIKLAREQKLFTVQRFFIVDSHSVDTTIETIKSSKADMMEVMPGVVPKVIASLKEKLSVPIIAGGLIETRQEAELTLKSGAYAISTGKADFWN